MARKNGKDRGILEFPNGSGQWWVRVFVNGREKRYRADSKSQAKAIYGRLKSEIREQTYFPEKYEKKRVAFRTLAEDYLKYGDSHHKRKGDDQPRMGRWIEALGDQDASTITLGQVEQVLFTMREEGYEPATIARYLVVLKACLNRAVRDGLLVSNPAHRVKPPKVSNILVRYATPEQEEALFKALPGRFHQIVLTALHTGLRQGELLRLKWEDIDWTAGSILVGEAKSGESRRVLINSTIWKVLEEHRVTRKDDRVFPHDARYLRRAFDKAVKDSGLSPFRFHDLRHTFASRLAMQGANDRTLQELLGHKTARMVLRYAHLSPTHLWHAVEGLTKVRPTEGRNQDRTVTKTVTRASGKERAIL